MSTALPRTMTTASKGQQHSLPSPCLARPPRRSSWQGEVSIEESKHLGPSPGAHTFTTITAPTAAPAPAFLGAAPPAPGPGGQQPPGPKAAPRVVLPAPDVRHAPLRATSGAPPPPGGKALPGGQAAPAVPGAVPGHPPATTFMSYNMTGADSTKCQLVRELAVEQEVDYVSLQEHFKTVKSTEQWFWNQYSDYHTYVIPAYRLPGGDSGRGRVGLAQLALRSTAVPRARVAACRPSCSPSPPARCSGLTATCHATPSWTTDNTELLTTLGEVQSLITTNSGCEVVWAADLNYDMRRNNHFTRAMAAALERMGLTSIWQGRVVDHTHVHTDGINSSVIDHFLVSCRLLDMVEECRPIHSGDNLSRHSAIFLSLRLGEVCWQQPAAQPPLRRMPAWDRASPQELHGYTMELHKRLQALQCPGSLLHCQDPKCEEPSHSEERDSTVRDILMAMVETSYSSLPLTSQAGGGRGPKIIPGWSTEVDSFRLDSNFCYRAWLAAGKPRQGVEYEPDCAAMHCSGTLCDG